LITLELKKKRLELQLRSYRNDAVDNGEKGAATSPQTDQVFGRTTIQEIMKDCWGQ